MAARNPSDLQHVSLVIEREGYGKLEWLQPVDVTGLDLQDIVSIERGECCAGCWLFKNTVIEGKGKL